MRSCGWRHDGVSTLLAAENAVLMPDVGNLVVSATGDRWNPRLPNGLFGRWNGDEALGPAMAQRLICGPQGHWLYVDESACRRCGALAPDDVLRAVREET